MKFIKIFFLFLFISSFQTAICSKFCPVNNVVQNDSTNIKFFTCNFNNLTLGNVSYLDTTVILTSYYDKLDNPYKIYQTLSNSGLAHKDINFDVPYNIGFKSELSAFSSYLQKIDNIKFPIVLQPFTNLYYTSADNKEQHLNILFCREFLPRFFLTINCDIDFSPGLYKYTKINNSYFYTNFRYNTNNNRYGIIGSFFHDKIDIQENGGIIFDSVFINNEETDKSIIDINLANATNLIKSSGFVIDQYFNLLGFVNSTNKDSTNRKYKIDIGRINYHFSYQNNRFVYEDSNPQSNLYQKFDPIIDPQKTFDSIYIHNIKNVIYWNNLGYEKYNNDIPIYITFGLEHDFSYHAGYVNLLTQECFNRHNYSNLTFNTGIIMNLLKSIRITGNAKVITRGYHSGDFLVDLQWKQFLGTSKKNAGALSFDVKLTKQSPDWFEEYYYSNNFRWSNDFKSEAYLQLKVSYLLPFIEIGLKQTNINNYIYFGTEAEPQQYLGKVNVNSLYSNFNIKFNKLEMIGFASLQTTTNNNVIHLPYFHGKIKLAYNIDLVKNISIMQPSIVFNYFTEYYADAYMPALRTFYLQDKVKVGNFPYIDFCVTFKIKNANVFVQYTNIYSLTGDNRYFTTPHYPMRDSRFCLGVSWRLYE